MGDTEDTHGLLGTTVLPRDLHSSSLKTYKPPTQHHSFSTRSPVASLATAYYTVTTLVLKNVSCPGSWENSDLLNVISASLITNIFFCNVCKRKGESWGTSSGKGSEFKKCPSLRMGSDTSGMIWIQGRDSAVRSTHLADPAEAEIALQDEVNFLLDTKGGDVTAEPQAVSNRAVLGTEK